MKKALCIIFCLLTANCASNGSYINCRDTMITYGEAIECVVLLDEQLKRME